VITFKSIFKEGYEGDLLSYSDFMQHFFPVSGWESENLGPSDWQDTEIDTDIYGFSYGDLEKPTVFIDGAMHGSERGPCYGLPAFMQCIANPPPEVKSIVQNLKQHISWYVIPILNPWGFENLQRKNINGVDINRNFDYDWQNGNDDPNSFDYRGPFAFSEKESQILRDKINALQPCVYANYHSHGSTRINLKLQTSNIDASREHEVLWRQMAKAMFLLGAESPYIAMRQGASAKGQAANWVYGSVTNSRGGTIPSIVPEIGDGEPTVDIAEGVRVQSIMAANLSLLYSIHAYHLITTKSLNPVS